MTTLKIIRTLQVITYLLISSQLLFYLLVLGDALKLVSIENFMEQRKAVDSIILVRYKWLYYSSLLICIAAVIVSARKPISPFFISSAIALICLVVDVLIAVNLNIPINAQFNSYGEGTGLTDWNAIRLQWLDFIRYRGISIAIGMLSLIIGLVWDRS